MIITYHLYREIMDWLGIKLGYLVQLINYLSSVIVTSKRQLCTKYSVYIGAIPKFDIYDVRLEGWEEKVRMLKQAMQKDISTSELLFQDQQALEEFKFQIEYIYSIRVGYTYKDDSKGEYVMSCLENSRKNCPFMLKFSRFSQDGPIELVYYDFAHNHDIWCSSYMLKECFTKNEKRRDAYIPRKTKYLDQFPKHILEYMHEKRKNDVPLRLIIRDAVNMWNKQGYFTEYDQKTLHRRVGNVYGSRINPICCNFNNLICVILHPIAMF